MDNTTILTCSNRKRVAVVMVPLPAQGHLHQLLHLSRLISAHGLPVYYVGAATHIRQAKLRCHGWAPSSIANLNFHEFPTTSFDNPPPDPHAPHKFPSQIVPSLLASTNLRQPVHAFVDGLSEIFMRVIVIYDSLMAYVVQDIENADCYTFCSTSCINACTWEATAWPVLPSEAEIILKQIPSVIGYYSDRFSEFLNLQFNAKNVSSGEIFNSNAVIEGLSLDLLSKNRQDRKIWGIGPFNVTKHLIRSDHTCLKWLDEQEQNSVILVSFGTTCSFSDEQIKEIAMGLERSDQRFIWVLRDADRGDIFTGDVRKAELPTGFEQRVRNRGIVVRDWAPQVDILGHQSTGGFLSHCGWNSCLESISMGVPIATWPMHSDQPANAVLITRVLNVGIEMKSWSGNRDEVVGWRRVESVVRKLMDSEEGDEMRRRAVELGNAVERSMSEGGDTHNEIASFITHISTL